MDKNAIIDFFNRYAPSWDSNMKIDDTVIRKIFHGGSVKKGADILDVACGTGVLFPYYERFGVSSVTGIDISPEMVKIAREKFPLCEIICGDAQDFNFDRKFDVVIIYNAFPHFESPEKLFKNLSLCLKKGGRITVAQGMSEEALRKHHENVPTEVSSQLPSKEEMKSLMEKYFEVDLMLSDSEMYQVSAVKK